MSQSLERLWENRMKNKRLLQLNDRFLQIKDKLNKIKLEVKFDNLLSDYKKLKKQIWKASTKPGIDREKIRVLESDKNAILKEFKKVDIVENELFSIRKNIVSIVSLLDNKKNRVDYTIKILQNKNGILEESIDPKTNDLLKSNIQENLKNIDKLQSNIDKLKEDKKPYGFLLYKIKKLKSEIKADELKLNKKINKDSVQNNIKRNISIISKRQLISDEILNEINYGVNLLNDIDSQLQFKDDDDINKNASFTVKHLDVFYGSKQALFDVNIEFPKNKVISIIGPSGCGKSTFLRTLNRINDNIENFRADGKILLDGEYNIFKLKSVINRYDKIELSTLRTKVGMIFQQPNPFPMSIIKNVQYGPKVKGIKNKAKLNELTENSLKEAGLWEEVKDNLKMLGTSLSGGQQQRLCIARAIANEPEILLMDEPTSALDPIAAKKIEDLILKLKKHYTVIMVTHSMQQAERISDYTAFFYQGNLIEYGKTKQIFNSPKQKETNEYITGKFG